jgi:hypothetical protein
MNIFVLDLDPVKAARAMDCVRVPKMVTESAQMMASALRRHGATDEQMPLTKRAHPTREATLITHARFLREILVITSYGYHIMHSLYVANTLVDSTKFMLVMAQSNSCQQCFTSFPKVNSHHSHRPCLTST